MLRVKGPILASLPNQHFICRARQESQSVKDLVFHLYRGMAIGGRVSTGGPRLRLVNWGGPRSRS